MLLVKMSAHCAFFRAVRTYKDWSTNGDWSLLSSMVTRTSWAINHRHQTYTKAGHRHSGPIGGRPGDRRRQSFGGRRQRCRGNTVWVGIFVGAIVRSSVVGKAGGGVWSGRRHCRRLRRNRQHSKGGASWATSLGGTSWLKENMYNVVVVSESSANEAFFLMVRSPVRSRINPSSQAKLDADKL
jgi:hypothetical protein